MTVLVLFVGPLYLALSYGLIVMVRRITKRRWPAALTLTLVIAWPVGDALWPKWVLSNYCDNEGPFIREIVENVEGIYLAGDEGCDRDCFYNLMEHVADTYRFVEAHVSARVYRHNGAPVSPEHYEKGYAPGPGLYRFTREKAGHPNCKVYERELARKPYNHDKPYYVENCIAAWPIREITAQYAVSNPYEEHNVGFGELRNFSHKVTRRSDGTNIFERNHYVFIPGLFWAEAFGPYTCQNDAPYSSYLNVLKPLPKTLQQH